ncbi:MAG: FkbM family methyltransferase [Candidatus Magasanikbacteria bacterium]|nr:FkbM family methyltransferase [Candidatus Magasanikbacteria bacterium]
MTITYKNIRKIIANPAYLFKYCKILKLYKFPRFTETTSDLLGFKIKIADSASFVFMYKEIFEKQVYKFNASSNAPVIIDCGANIGMSVVYFKKLFPLAKIVAFEPDPNIFRILKENIDSQNFSDIKLVNSALWSEEGAMDFFPDRADGGRVAEKISGVAPVLIPAVKLSGYLNEKVDFLKIDIEGAELEVLRECKDALKNVKNIFIEYHSFADKSQKLDELLLILKEDGFRYYIDNFSAIQRQPFSIRGVYSGMDMQLNIYAINERAI